MKEPIPWFSFYVVSGSRLAMTPIIATLMNASLLSVVRS